MECQPLKNWFTKISPMETQSGKLGMEMELSISDPWSIASNGLTNKVIQLQPSLLKGLITTTFLWIDKSWNMSKTLSKISHKIQVIIQKIQVMKTMIKTMKFKMKREVAMKNEACIKERRRPAEAK